MHVIIDISEMASDVVTFLDSLGKYPNDHALGSLLKVCNDYIDNNNAEDHVCVDDLGLTLDEYEMMEEELRKFSRQLWLEVRRTEYELVRIIKVTVKSLSGSRYRITALLNCEDIVE